MSSLLNMEFVQALNPLYAFPIVAVILCAFIVYAFGFKSPVQPPSFDGIEEEKKISKKRKTKESNKGKIVQNGKLNGNSSNKVQVLPSNKKRDAEKSISADKPVTEKSPAAEKKANKKAKSQSEKKPVPEKKKENISVEDTGEDGWVQLISKKGRKSRKKDEACSTENQVTTKSPKTSPVKSSESIPSEESQVKASDIVENSVPKNKPSVKEEEKKDVEVPVIESSKDRITVTEDTKVDASSLEKENEKLPEESSNKSKKKKKKNCEAVNMNDSVVNQSESPVMQVISELSSQNANNSSDVAKIPDTINGKVEEDQPKESKSSNVVFDELADLFPEPKEQRKKKRVRRDH